jgi:hypothetical protein
LPGDDCAPDDDPGDGCVPAGSDLDPEVDPGVAGRKMEVCVSPCSSASGSEAAAEEGEEVVDVPGERPNHPVAPSSREAADSGLGVEALVSGFGGVTGGRGSRVSAEFSRLCAASATTGSGPAAGGNCRPPSAASGRHVVQGVKPSSRASS